MVREESIEVESIQYVQVMDADTLAQLAAFGLPLGRLTALVPRLHLQAAIAGSIRMMNTRTIG